MNSKIINKYNNMTIQAKAAVWFTVCNMIPQFVTVIMTTVFTRVLSTTDYGISSNYMAWYNIICIFITLNLSAGVYNNAMLKYENDRDGFTSSMMSLSLLLGLFGVIVAMLFNDNLALLMSLPKSLIICMALQCMFYNSYGCWMSRVKFEYNYIRLLKVTLLVSILSPLFSLLFVFICENKAVGKVFGQSIIYILLGAFLYLSAFKKNNNYINKEYWIYSLKFNVPLIPHYLSLIILNQSDRIMITSMCGASDNGLYSLAYSAASLLLILNSGITQALTPWAYRKLKSFEPNEIRKYTSAISMIYVLIVTIFISIAPELIYILAGEKYASAVYVIPPVATSMYLIFLYNLYSIVEFYFEKTKPVMICSVISASMNVYLNFKFIPIFGYLAAAYTTLGCYMLNSIMHAIVLKKIHKMKLNGISAINIRVTLFAGMGLILISVFSSAVYPFLFIRLGIIGILLIMMVINRSKIANIMKKLRNE